MEFNEIYLGDCLDLIPKLPSKSVDLVLTDPPFNTTDIKFDKEKLGSTWLSECLRVVKDDGYLVSFGSIEVLADIGKVFTMRFSGVWDKIRPVMRTHSAKKPMSKTELYAVYAHPNHKIKNLTWNPIKNYGYKPYSRMQHNRGYKRGGKDSLDRASAAGFTKQGYTSVNDGFRWQTDLIEAPNKPGMRVKERTPHPTQKPLDALYPLIKWFTNPNDVILDPFMGSGSTIEAAIIENRQWIGFEKSEQWFEVARKRIDGRLWGLF